MAFPQHVPSKRRRPRRQGHDQPEQAANEFGPVDRVDDWTPLAPDVRQEITRWVLRCHPLLIAGVLSLEAFLRSPAGAILATGLVLNMPTLRLLALAFRRPEVGSS